MKIVQVAGRFFALLTPTEFDDLHTCVEAYAKGVTSPQMKLAPEIREFYPDTATVSHPIPESIWDLHAKMGTAKARRTPETQGG